MLQVTYLCFLFWRLIMQSTLTKQVRVALFSRRLAGLMGGIVLGGIVGWQFGWIVLVLALWGPVAFGEWAALQYARERNLPGADGRRLPIY